ncbi:hypothetical protein fugu_019074 [Takifugu bimaculatus]|uniref:Myosin motor domain-containing protein n=1 Tax=Takifugu bimaculatus TaxID=433685 RepID=A0A4Z2BJF4_9TELE|nr:hypothetical protein fugu_019074 [Takifugu bimaculatus]
MPTARYVKIKEEKTPLVTATPPPAVSVIPGGFLKQLVRESEKETKQKEPEVKEERPPSKLSNDLVQQFLVPDQTPPILEAEMSLRAEQINGSGRCTLTPDGQNKQEARQEVRTQPSRRSEERRSTIRAEPEEEKVEEAKPAEQTEERLQPEGRQAEANVTENDRRQVRDVWYEAGRVWYVHKDGFTPATQLKPDEGTPELPDGMVRVRLDTDGSLHDVTEYETEQCNPPEQNLCEDLSNLQHMNECGVLNTLSSRARADMPLTHAGPNLVSFWPPIQTHSKTPKSRRGDYVWDAPPALAALVKRVHVSMVGSRRDHSVCAVGRSGTGKTAACQAFTHALLKQAGTAGEKMSVERVHAMFTVLRSFGCVSSQHSDASSRFAMSDVTVCVSEYNISIRTELQLHQLPETNTFGIIHPTKVEEKQRASVAFTKLLAAMETLGFSATEQKAIWHVLAAIYHLGAAGACRVGRRQFVSFDSAQKASSVLGCEGDELHTAVFKHHLRQLLQRATTGGSRERSTAAEAEEGPRLTAVQCLEGMAAGLYEELFTAIVSLINRALSSQQLTLASVMVVDTPGLRNPRHSAEERGASWSELCHNYLQERLLEHYHTHTFTHTLERYAQERIPVELENPENSPAEVVSAIDQPPPQVRAADGDPRGLLWVLDEEMVTPGSNENSALERVCQYFSGTVRQCEQPLQCEVNHLMGCDPVRYDLTGWFGLIQNNPSSLNATCLLQNSTIGVVKAMFTPRISLPPLCRGLGGLEGNSQRSLQRNGTIRKTFSGGMSAMRRHSQCIAVKLQTDALVNLIRRARPMFLQCVHAKSDAGSFDVPALRAQLQSTQILSALQFHRTGYPEHMTLSDFRCHFQALSPPIMKRYASMFVSHDERKAVEELLADLDLDKKSVVIGDSRVRPPLIEPYESSGRKASPVLLWLSQVFMKRGVLQYLEQQRDQQVTGWLVYLQASCRGHVARQKYRKLKARLDQCKVTMGTLEKQLEEEKQRVQAAESQRGAGTDGELAMQLECCQTEVEFVRRRLKQTEEKLENERQSRQQLDAKAQLEQSRRSANELKRHCRRVTSDLQDARVLTDSLQGRVHELERKQRRFDSELAQALEEAENERDQKDKALQETTALGTEIYTLRRNLQDSQTETEHLQQQKEELCAQIRDLSLPIHLASESLPDLKKQLRLLESQASERAQEVTTLSAKIQQQQQVHMRFEMELERMKQMHQKELEDKEEELEDVHKSSQRRVGHRDFDVEKKLRRDLKRTHALLADAQLLLSTVDSQAPNLPNGSREQIERLHCQLEDREARLLETESIQKTLAQELENTQIELENICRQKSLVDEQLALLHHEKMDLLKRVEEDQEDLNELMKKHKALIAQSSSDISQIRELQAELEEVTKQRHSLQEQLQQCVSRVQFLESSTVGRSIVSKQEARVCDLENKLEFQRGQVKRFEVLVLRLRDSVVRLGEELEQSAQAEARERENARYYQQRLQDMRLEMEDLTQREQESGRRRMELEMQVEELSAVRQTLQADLETSIRRIVDLQAALEEVESSDESDAESAQTAVESLTRKKDLDSVSSVGTEDVGEGIRNWLGVPRGASRGSSSPYGSSTISSQGGRQSVTDTMSTYSFRSCVDDEGSEVGGTRGLGRAPSSSALSELLDGLRKRRAGGDAREDAGSTISLPVYPTTAATTLRRRASALSLAPENLQEPRPGPSILKPSSPLLPRASSARSVGDAQTSAASCAPGAKLSRFSSSDSLSSLPSLPRLSTLASSVTTRHRPPSQVIPEEEPEQPLLSRTFIQRSPQVPRKCILGSLITEDGEEATLGPEPLVFQSRRLVGDNGLDDTASDILPAIRRAQSTSSLASSVRGGRRALSVHFGELPPSTRSRRSSETESSSSGGSGGSSQGRGPRRKLEGPQGERLEAGGQRGGRRGISHEKVPEKRAGLILER